MSKNSQYTSCSGSTNASGRPRVSGCAGSTEISLAAFDLSHAKRFAGSEGRVARRNRSAGTFLLGMRTKGTTSKASGTSGAVGARRRPLPGRRGLPAPWGNADPGGVGGRGR